MRILHLRYLSYIEKGIACTFVKSGVGKGGGKEAILVQNCSESEQLSRR